MVWVYLSYLRKKLQNLEAPVEIKAARGIDVYKRQYQTWTANPAICCKRGVNMDKKIRRNKIRRVRQVRRVKKILLSGVLVMAALLLVFLVFVPKVSAKRESKAQAAREIELEAKMTKVTIGAVGT